MKRIVKSLLCIFLFLVIFNSDVIYAAQVHRVAPGESLFVIAQKYGVTVSEIVAKNNLRNPERIFPRQVLIIPGKQQQSLNNMYVVKPGDSLFLISQKLGVTMEALANANSITNWDLLYVGQVLKIPKLEPKVQQSPSESYMNSIAYLAKEFRGDFYLSGPTNTNRVALTFDDGPDGKYTPQVLDVLKQYKVPATFFLIGERSARYSWVVDRIFKEGHLIGNHSWSHPNLAKVSRERLEQEISNTERILHEITGKNTALIRPPYGAVSRESLEYMKKVNYKIINWNVDSVDWRDRDVDQILINTLPDVKPGAILLFHSAGGEGQSMAATVQALPEIIYTLRVQGYEFVALDDLIGIPAYK
ncbi:MAG: polysaccharide deacetylase family protein [Bacillota bacterium]